MAKISSYPSDAQVTTSDRLIGSDNENSNETKNFQIGDIISLAASVILPPGGVVPYTGATGNVDLGAYGLTTSYLTSTYGMFIDGAISLSGNEGNTGDILISQGPGATPSWTSLSGTYVPYTGATGNVDLGTYDINADAATFSVVNTQDIYSSTLYNVNSNPTIFVGDDSLQPVGLLINTSTKTFKLGDYNGNFNTTHIAIEDGSSRITFVGGFNLSNGQGTAGQVLTSVGAGATPTWTSLPSLAGFVPYTGATGGVNLGIYSLTAANINANNFVPIVGGSGNTFFGGTGGYNVALNGIYALGTDVTVVGNSSSSGNGTKITISDSTDYIDIFANTLALNGISSLNLINGFGAVGDILVSNNTSAPSWQSFSSLVNVPYLSAYSNALQTAGAANTAISMSFNNVSFSNNMGISNNLGGIPTQITFYESGIYNVQFSAQIRRTTGGASATIDIWFRYGGVDIPQSNTSVNVQANAGFLVTAWNFFANIDINDPSHYLELMWATTDIAVQIYAATASSPHPATPSVILTVNKVSN